MIFLKPNRYEIVYSCRSNRVSLYFKYIDFNQGFPFNKKYIYILSKGVILTLLRRKQFFNKTCISLIELSNFVVCRDWSLQVKVCLYLFMTPIKNSGADADFFFAAGYSERKKREKSNKFLLGIFTNALKQYMQKSKNLFAVGHIICMPPPSSWINQWSVANE